MVEVVGVREKGGAAGSGHVYAAVAGAHGVGVVEAVTRVVALDPQPCAAGGVIGDGGIRAGHGGFAGSGHEDLRASGQPHRLRLTVFDLRGSADVHQRPSATSIPLDGNERVEVRRRTCAASQSPG